MVAGQPRLVEFLGFFHVTYLDNYAGATGGSDVSKLLFGLVSNSN
jgi:hypothetical protein